MKTLPFILGSILLASCGSRRNGVDPIPVIQGNTVDVSFRSGRDELPIFEHERAFYLLGEEGLEYRICLRNRAPVRVEAVLSVDGRDVVSGRTADYRRDRGYVLDPREEVCVEGFRESTESVAAFTFAKPEESYASRMGDASNVGVIGIAVFDEDVPAADVPPSVIAASPDDHRYNDYDEAAPAEAAAEKSAGKSAAEPEASIGTAYGSSVASRAETVPFVRRDAERPAELTAVYYDDSDGLEAKGIRISKNVELTKRTPTPFPGVDDRSGYAPPPP